MDMENTQTEINWQDNASTDSNPVIRVGFWSVCVAMFVFIAWASLFPLSSAVITLGVFASDGHNKTIQHPSGGRVAEVHVEEGDRVAKNAPIVTLDQTNARADLTRVEARHASLSALKARLDAERSGTKGMIIRPGDVHSGSKIYRAVADLSALRGVPASGQGKQSAKLKQTIPRLVLRGTSPQAKIQIEGQPDTLITNSIPHENDTLFQSQREAYASGRKLLNEEVEGLAKKVDTLVKQKNGLEARSASQSELLKMAQREFKRLQPLAEAGYVARNRLNERRRTILELEGSVASLGLDAQAVDLQIEEVRVEMRRARTRSSDLAHREYSRIVGELAELSDQLIAARENLDKLVIRAPVAGTVAKLTGPGVAGVLGGGEVFAEVVPSGSPLMVQARVSPSDIDHVQIGHQAEIAVTAFNRRMDDTLQGRVVFKAADATTDEKTGETFFLVRLALDGVSGRGESRLGDIQPGMEGEIYIQTGSRTLMTYLFKPLSESFRKAFRES